LAATTATVTATTTVAATAAAYSSAVLATAFATYLYKAKKEPSWAPQAVEKVLGSLLFISN
jgi:hypothetical protein